MLTKGLPTVKYLMLHRTFILMGLLTHINKHNHLYVFITNLLQFYPNGSMFISRVYMEDQGLYGCTANNSAGTIHTSVSIYVASKFIEILIIESYAPNWLSEQHLDFLSTDQIFYENKKKAKLLFCGFP